MTYLNEFKKQIDKRDYQKFFQLWEEYCTNDRVDADEFILLLKLIKGSDASKHFGPFVETALPLWKMIEDEKKSLAVIKLLIDLETTNSPALVEITLQTIEKYYGNDPLFKDHLRQVGLREKQNFQGSISNFALLVHMVPKNCVFHTAGWGTGEIVEVSPLREQVSIEFENVAGIKHINFENAFKTLIPLESDNFLARRFSDPDDLEKEAKEDPVGVIKLLLRDLGPKTAAEIKDELSELVIPESEWTKWWQSARTRLKKDTMIYTPEKLSESFALRETEFSHEDRLLKAIQHKVDPTTIIQTAYSHVRDYPNLLKNEEIRKALLAKLTDLFTHEGLTEDLKFQLLMFLEGNFNYKTDESLKEFVQKLKSPEEVIDRIEIIALKKRALSLVKENRENWAEIFANMLFKVTQGPIRDYIISELNEDLLVQKLDELLANPKINPEFFVWYFQKITAKEKGDTPFHNKEGQNLFFEGFLVLLQKIENDPEYKELTKKMYNLLIAKRYELVRILIKDTSIDFINEFLLLTSKCHTFTDHDQKTLKALAHVVHPSLAPKPKSRASSQVSSHILWTTREGYLRTQERMKQIATVEMIENAREVEAARALGDLRENSEYKFAVEKRARLQSEIRTLSQQFNRARVISKEDIFNDEIGVGCVVELLNPVGDVETYTILGPWDINPEKGIISFQSKLAAAMIGCKVGESIGFKDENYTVKSIRSYV